MRGKLKNVEIALSSTIKINAVKTLEELGYITIGTAKVAVHAARLLSHLLVVAPITTVSAIVSPEETIAEILVDLEVSRVDRLVHEDLVKTLEPKVYGECAVVPVGAEHLLKSWAEDRIENSLDLEVLEAWES